VNRATSVVVRTAIIALALVILGWVLRFLLPGARDPEEMGLAGRFALPFVSALLLGAPLAFPIGRSRLRGMRLYGAVALAVLGLTTVLTQVESAVFLNMTSQELAIETLRLTIMSLVLAGLATALYAVSDGEPVAARDRPNPATAASWIRRWLGVSCLYVVLYIAAGLLILPIIRPWYEAQGLLDPNPAVVFPLQIVRGALFVAFVMPLLRSLSVTRRQASLAMAIMIPLLHGVAVLIPPNPFMPDYVRHAHMVEIGWSNFVLGLLIGFLFWNPQPQAGPQSGG